MIDVRVLFILKSKVVIYDDFISSVTRDYQPCYTIFTNNLNINLLLGRVEGSGKLSYQGTECRRELSESIQKHKKGPYLK